MTPGKDQIVIQSSEAFKDALGKYAEEHDQSMADVIRKATAVMIGYDLINEPKIARAHQYATEAEKKEAQSTRSALLRWGRGVLPKMIASGNIDAAQVIARAISEKDYESIEALRLAFEGVTDTTEDSAE
jgi:hypothetical protein